MPSRRRPVVRPVNTVPSASPPSRHSCYFARLLNSARNLPTMNQVMLEQGRLGLMGTPEQPVDNLRLSAPDNDTKTHVYLLVFADDYAHPRDWHWSISWKVGGLKHQSKGWRHVHVQVHNIMVAPGPGVPPRQEKRYVFWGGLTKPEGALTSSARKISLGKMSLAARTEIERMALSVPVLAMGSMGGRWNCQEWVKALGARLIDARIVSQNVWESALVDAYRRAYALDGRFSGTKS